MATKDKSNAKPAHYPEHEKLAKVKDKSQAIGEFLDYGLPEGVVLARYDKYDRLYPINESITKILENYFEIDGAELENEKRQMLDSIRTA